MAPDFVDQLQHHAKALRALARDLVGEQHADDLLQDAAVQAMVAPPRQPGPLGGWFAAVLRHLASKQRRGERRRQRREQLAARPEAQPGADVEVAARDQFQRLNDAVLALPQPYQGVLLRRYLKEQTPGEIAAVTSVPLATVKSQLQRGLQLLRERLERGGGEWRAGLAAAFALREAAVATAAGTVATGALIMAGAGKLVGLAAAAVLAVTAVWWLRPGEPAAPAGAGAGMTATTPAVVADADGTRQDAREAAATAPQRTLLGEPRPAEVTIRGRCVDDRGAPLAGCRVSLSGKPNDDREFEFWVRHHYDPQWQDPSAVDTAADGCFEFRFLPHEPLVFRLLAKCDGHVAMRAAWPARTYGAGLTPGAVIDLGDVALLPGVQVRGRVVDDAGEPIAGVRVHLDVIGNAKVPSGTSPIDSDIPRTDANGQFAAAPLAPGTYLVSPNAGRDGYSFGHPEKHELREPWPWIDLQLTRTVLAPSVQGIIVDPHGDPVAFASVQWPSLSRVAYSKDDGTFAFFAAEAGDAPPESLRVERDGFETLVRKGPFPWGTTDLRAVLQRGVDVALQVVDAQGQPVEDFAAWLWPDYDDRPKPHVFFPGDQHARTFGHHADGQALLHGLRRGRHRLYVEPRAEWLMATEVLRVELGDPSPVTLRVQLPAAAERLVRVVDRRGGAVADTGVELLEQSQGAFDATAKAWPIEQMLSMFGPVAKALVRQHVVTDGNGEARLRGPVDGRFAVRCPGPHNLPQFQGGVRLDDPTPLVVQVQRGGNLQVELRPAGVVAALRGYAGLGEQLVPTWEPKLQLLRPAAPGAEVEPDVRELQLPVGGKAAMAGLPTGTWQMYLVMGVRSSPLAISRARLGLGLCTLRDGETTTAVLDLPQLLPATLRTTALHNGMPLVKTALLLRGSFAVRDPDLDAADSDWLVPVATDDAGVFTSTVCPGRYTVEFSHVSADQVITIAPGDSATATFTVRSGTLRVHYADAGGKAVPQVDAILVDPDSGEETMQLAFSDADGDSITTTVAARRFLLFARHVHPDDRPDTRLPLGEVTVREGQTTTIERTLPPSWLGR